MPQASCCVLADSSPRILQAAIVLERRDRQMQTASGATSNAAEVARPTAFSEKALASLAATGGMHLLLCAYWTLDSYGPASRVVFYEYLPFQSALNNLLAAFLGTWLGARLYRLFRPQARFSGARLVAGCLLGAFLGLVLAGILLLTSVTIGTPEAPTFAIAVILPAVGAWWCGTVLFRAGGPAKLAWRGWLASGAAALIGVWLIHPQFTAFPSHGSIAERQAWARLHIPQYAYLERTIENIPVIQDSIGRVTAIAPAPDAQHVTGLDMDGVAMKLVLDVMGERGVGTLSVDCTIDQDAVFNWQPAIWIAAGKTTEIATVPNLLRRQ
jgi:hypothetical protein